VATLEETHLFPEYVSPMLQRWRSRDPGRKVGLGTIIGEAQFRGMARDLVLRVLEVALTDKPGADVILEKTPVHLHFAQDILELFPDARFVHIIRDPRAVVSSLLDAARTWGRDWAPRSAYDSAGIWREAIQQGIRLRGITDNYTEVIYESLVRSPHSELARAFGACGLVVEPEFCERAISACAKENLRAGSAGVWAPSSMQGNLDSAVRRGEVDGWREELGRFDLLSVEKVASGLMGQFGYSPVLLRESGMPFDWYIGRGLQRARALAEMLASAFGWVGKATRRGPVQSGSAASTWRK